MKKLKIGDRYDCFYKYPGCEKKVVLRKVQNPALGCPPCARKNSNVSIGGPR